MITGTKWQKNTDKGIGGSTDNTYGRNNYDD